MNVFGIGIDVVDLERFGRVLARHGERFEEKAFTPAERRYCRGKRDPVPHFAARFAAKEAVAKALGTGIGADLGWLDMDITHAPRGGPRLDLAGAGARFAAAHGIERILISLTHAKTHAAANALALGGGVSAGAESPGLPSP
jgi:holo-[acyl-carrier protein] synthase